MAVTPATRVDQLLMVNGAEFVDQAYRSILRRSPDREGRQHHLARLRAGIAKEEVLLAIADSAEARALPCTLEGMDQLRGRVARKSRFWNSKFRELERSVNQMAFAIGEMHAATDGKVDLILDRLEVVESTLANLGVGGGSMVQPPTNPGQSPMQRPTWPLKETVGEVTATEPSSFIKELRIAVRKSSESMTLASVMAARFGK